MRIGQNTNHVYASEMKAAKSWINQAKDAEYEYKRQLDVAKDLYRRGDEGAAHELSRAAMDAYMARTGKR